MHLGELCEQLLPRFRLSMQKDVKTAVGYLATALDCADPQHCTPELYHQPLPTLYTALENSLRACGKGPHTIRNTKNSISRLFREAEAQQLLMKGRIAMTQHQPKQPEALTPIIQDFLRYMRRYRDPAYTVETRRRNERKAWQAFSVMTAEAQRLALSLITLG